MGDVRSPSQGTVRPLSERGFFMLFSYLFGLHALPYRIFVFLNQFLNIVLVMLVTRKLTRSELAGLLAPLFWLSNMALIVPMSWNSSYNEIQCATFLLLSFYLFIRYTETGERRFYWAQLIVFVLGFGGLEINVVYPAIAALYALLFARRYLRSTLPMLAVSAVFE
jgi:4-amino-4-deoxy-L-arabinose transferase-like glycosyltransferase